MTPAPHVSSIFDLVDLERAILDGFVNRQTHPVLPLYILNYSAKSQWEQEWNPVTENCRGLIIDDMGNIVARPFAKFHNYASVAVPKYALTTPPLVTEKQDGSLGVVFMDFDGPRVATRGSFASDQAIWATEWLRNNMLDYSQPEHVTTLVEIIYPQNRIVVDYQGREDLVLLAAIDNHTGADIPLWEVDWWPGSVTPMHTGLGDADNAYRFATSYDFDEREGVVCTWYRPNEPSFRLKIKNPRYLELHRLFCSSSTKTVWEALAKGESPEKMAEAVPDEFYNWMHGVVDDLREKYRQIEAQASLDFFNIKDASSRRAFAEAAKKLPNSGLLFSMLDGKDYSEAIWKLVKPEYARPFISSAEEEI